MSDGNTTNSPTLITLVRVMRHFPDQPRMVKEELEAPASLTSIVELELAADVVSVQLFAATKVVVDVDGKPTAAYLRVTELSPKYYVVDAYIRATRMALGSDKATLTILWLPNGRGRIVATKEPATSAPTAATEPTKASA